MCLVCVLYDLHHRTLNERNAMVSRKNFLERPIDHQ